MTMPIDQTQMIARLARWGEANPLVRAVLLTSTRAVPGAVVDDYSDFDVILALQDIRPFYEEREWLGDFGPVLAVYRDPLLPEMGLLKGGYIVQYEDGLKIDFTLWPVEVLQAVTTAQRLPDELDAGYQVVLDKDGTAAFLQPPTYQAYIPKPPDEIGYLENMETFFLDACYVGKYLRRGDLPGAKIVLDYYIKQENLIPMLEWRVEMDNDWRVKPGPFGRGLKQRLPPDLWVAFERTYVGPGSEENWRALWETVDLYCAVAREVGERLGFAYPEDLDRRARAFLRKIQEE